MAPTGTLRYHAAIYGGRRRAALYPHGAGQVQALPMLAAGQCAGEGREWSRDSMPWNACRAAALEVRAQQLFMETKRDPVTKMPTQGRSPFPLTAFPDRIGQDSVGLGLYFTTQALLIGLVLTYAAVSVYPVMSNWNAEGYSTDFQLTQSLGGITSTAVCDKSYDVRLPIPPRTCMCSGLVF